MAANSPNFSPVPAPLDQKEMGRYIENELRRVAASLDYLDDAHVGGKRTDTNATAFTLHAFHEKRTVITGIDFPATEAGLEAAYDALTAGGGTILVPKNTTISVGASGISGKANVRLLGEDKFTSVIQLTANPTADFFSFVSQNNWSLENLTIDWNDRAATAGSASVAVRTCSRFIVTNCRIIKIGIFGIALNGCNSYSVTENYVDITTAVNTQNEAIIVSEAAGISTKGVIERNECARTGINVSGSSTKISGNRIYDFKFGAGITTEQAATCHSLVITGNVITGGTGTDVNAYACGGIENWAARTVIANNIISDNSGSGIDQGGKACSVTGNVVFNNGVTSGSGITSRYQDATYNAGFSTYVGNVSFNTGGVSGPQDYGYEDQSASLSYITIQGNRFKDNALGAQRILGSSYSVDVGSLNASATYDPPSLADGSGVTTDVLCAGAALNDFVIASFSNDLQGVSLNGWVNASNNVKVRFQNETGATVDLASGTIRVRVIKPIDAADY